MNDNKIMRRVLKKIWMFLNKAEELGWGVDINVDDFCITFSKYSPYGQDYSFEVYFDDVAECVDIRRYLVDRIYGQYEDYDPSYEAYLWLDSTGHGTNGAPHEMIEVYNDMKACEENTLELYRELYAMLRGDE